MSFNLSLHGLLSSIRVIHLHFKRVHISAFLLKDLLDFSISYCFKANVTLASLHFRLQFVDLLQ